MAKIPAVLFVCLGNICRSPLAEAAFRAAAQAAGLEAEADSAGTGGWHAGQAPDKRARDEARRHGIDISAYRARQITPRDFTRFTHVFALDGQNLADLRKLRPADASAHLGLLMDLVPGSRWPTPIMAGRRILRAPGARSAAPPRRWWRNFSRQIDRILSHLRDKSGCRGGVCAIGAAA